MEKKYRSRVITIDAVPMSLGDYNKRRGWDMPVDEDPSSKGYFITYPSGLHTWQTLTVFNSLYKELRG